MVGASSTGHQTGSGILNRLQPVHRSFRDAEEQRVAVVQASRNERLDKCLTHIFRQRPDSLPQLVVAASTDHSIVDTAQDHSDVSRQQQSNGGTGTEYNRQLL